MSIIQNKINTICGRFYGSKVYSKQINNKPDPVECIVPITKITPDAATNENSIDDNVNVDRSKTI